MTPCAIAAFALNLTARLRFIYLSIRTTMDLHASIDDVLTSLIRVVRDEARGAATPPAPAPTAREAELVQEFRWRVLVLLTANRLDYDAFADAFSDKPL